MGTIKSVLLAKQKGSSKLSTRNGKNQVIKSNTNFLPVGIAFLIFFIYGFLLLMVSYTGGPIVAQVTKLSDYPQLSPIPQTCGLVVVVLALRFLIKRFNMRLIMAGGFLIAMSSIVLTSRITVVAGTDRTVGTLIYIIANFMLGIGVGAVSPGIVVYFSQRFSGTKRNVMLSAVNGFYGMGAGIIPLALSSLLYKHTSGSNINSVINFLYVAIALAVVGFLCSWLLNVPPTKSDAVSSKQSKTKKDFIPFTQKYMTQKKLLFCIFMVILFYVSYMFVETTANYNLNNIIKGSNTTPLSDKEIKDHNITAFRCIGLLFVVQGVWRALSGLTVCKKVKFRHFLIASVVLIVAAYILLLTKIASPDHYANKAVSHHNDYIPYAYLVTLLLAFGLGNVWPVLTSYVTSIDDSRAAFISVWLNRTAQITILATQLIVGYSVATTATTNNPTPVPTYTGVFIAGIAMAVIFVILMAAFPTILKRLRIPITNDLGTKHNKKIVNVKAS